jgi:hypothetical protein
MSQENFQQFMTKLSDDADLAERFHANPRAVAFGHKLTPTEFTALMTGDGEAQQLLAGTEVAGFTMWAVSPSYGGAYSYYTDSAGRFHQQSPTFVTPPPFDPSFNPYWNDPWHRPT